jgi:hypothetical protein
MVAAASHGAGITADKQYIFHGADAEYCAGIRSANSAH